MPSRQHSLQFFGCGRCIETSYCEDMKAWAKTLILLSLFIVYIFLGSFAFLKMEQPQEYAAKEEFFTYLQVFVRNNSACELSVAELRTLLVHVNLVKANGLRHAERIFTDGVSNIWTWPNSIVFAATIVTTVGKYVAYPVILHKRINLCFGSK